MENGSVMTSAPSFSPTRDRVRAHTSQRLNHKIDQASMKRIWYYASRPKEEISRRINALDHEWDLERAVEVAYAATTLMGVALGAARSKRWLALPALMMSCMLHHATTGSAPTVLIFRQLGYRTRREIDAEKYALKMLRGDFDTIKNIAEGTHRAIEALRLSRI